MKISIQSLLEGARNASGAVTLFALAAAEPASAFYKALDRWCSGTLDAQTLRLLEAGGREC